MSNVLRFPSNGRRPATDEVEQASRADRVDEASPRLREVIGDVLRDERQQQERTLRDIAEEAAVSLPYLSEIERGRKDVSSDVLAAVCDALHVPLADVLERSADRLRLGAGPQRGSSFQLLAA